MTKPLSSYSQALLCILGCSFASAHSHHTATEVIANHSNHKQSIPLAKIASGHIVGDSVFVVNTPGPKELPPGALSALGPNWKDDSADGFRLVAGAIGPETQGESLWEAEGSHKRGQQTFGGNGITTSWTFNSVDGHCHLPDGAIINAIYATWTTRGKSGAVYTFTEGSDNSLVQISHLKAPRSDLKVNWTDSEHIVRTANFEKIFKEPILIKGRDGFTLKGQKIRGRNSHQTDAILLDVSLRGHQSHKPYRKMLAKPTLSVSTEAPAKGAHEAPAGEVPVAPGDMPPLDERTPKKKKIHQVGPPDAKFELIWVEPGSFIMGSPEDESGRKFNENQHQVTLTQGYYLGKHEVTQAQYKWVMGALPDRFAKDDKQNKGDNFPVGGADWNDAMAFCKKLTEMERKAGRLPKGMSFQLPTEAEWEYACKAGTTTIYSWGNHPDQSKANFGHGFKVGKDFVDQVQTVGKYEANPWGFHDMHGNVYEWCNDTATFAVPTRPGHHEIPYPKGPVKDPQGHQGDSVHYQFFDGKAHKLGPGVVNSKIQRGGSWMSGAGAIRSAYRHSHPLYDKVDYKGFRVALKRIKQAKVLSN